MFKWNVEEMKLMNDIGVNNIGREKMYSCEDKLTTEEKIKFVDEMQEGKLTYILELINKFNKDKDNGIIKTTSSGLVKTVSLKPWIKKNDSKKIVDDWYHYGKFNFLRVGRYIQTIEDREKYINEVFHNQLKLLESKEKQWFLEHDEYSILTNKVEDYIDKYGTFGLYIIQGSDGIELTKSNSDWEGRKFTIEELKKLISYYEKLSAYEKKLSEEIDIKF